MKQFWNAESVSFSQYFTNMDSMKLRQDGHVVHRDRNKRRFW